MKDILMEYGIFSSDEACEKLQQYCGMLIEKNKVMDLTNVPEEEIPERHFVDSLLPLRFDLIPENGSLADVGTGAGFPGMPIAIMNPKLNVTLIDAQEKRCAFLREVKEKLALHNVTVLHMRAEDAGKNKSLRASFDVCTARAVAPLNVLEEYLIPLIRKGGCALCWKGPGVKEELPAAIRASRILNAVTEEPFLMPMPGMQHYIVKVLKCGDTPNAYPRKNGTPSKQPLGTEK